MEKGDNLLPIQGNLNNFFPCFQVQSDHYEELFAPELDKHGYQALYKRKTNEVVKLLLVIVAIHVSSSIFIINA
jgi:mRNA deadenylase 3'-5' endonuclease subunit Ccr4